VTVKTENILNINQIRKKIRHPFRLAKRERCAVVSFCLILGSLLFSGALRADEDLNQELFKPFQSTKIHPENSPYILDFTLNNSYESYGPLAFKQEEESLKRLAIPPFFTVDRNKDLNTMELDSFYPLFGGSRHGEEYRIYFLQVLNWAGGMDDEDKITRRFTFFPFFFHQRSPDPNENYWAILPFYGHVQRRVWRESFEFYMMPLYIKTVRKGATTKNYLAPFFHVRRGDGLKGWQFWPIVCVEDKVVTTTTDDWGDEVLVPGHKDRFYIWPIVLQKDTGIGTDNPSKFFAVLPFYAQTRSPNRDHSIILWPFFNWVDDREQKYKEWSMPYPIVDFARGEGKRTDRIFPFFSYATKGDAESDFILWPAWKRRHYETEAVAYERERLLFYLYSDIERQSKKTGDIDYRTDAFPLFTATIDPSGTYRVVMLSLFEPFFHGSVSVQRNWTPLCSLWTLEENKKDDFLKEAVFWNFYRHEKVVKQKKWSILFGMFQFVRDEDYGNYWRVFWSPDKRKAKEAREAKEAAKTEENKKAETIETPENTEESAKSQEISVLPINPTTQE